MTHNNLPKTKDISQESTHWEDLFKGEDLRFVLYSGLCISVQILPTFTGTILGV